MKYISEEDGLKILNEIKRNYTIREEVIARLMYECGFRINEILGATNDDLIANETLDVRDDDNRPTQVEADVLYIRNRISDKPYQVSKTVMNVSNKKDYQSREYNTEHNGYQVAIIFNRLIKLIDDYIDEAHLEAMNKNKELYLKNVIADRVREITIDDMLDYNFYVFIDDEGKPLTDTEWNKTLRDIFKACNIKFDEDEDLNERFRYSFVVNFIEANKEYSDEQLQGQLILFLRGTKEEIEPYFYLIDLQRQRDFLEYQQEKWPWLYKGVE